MNLKSLTRWLVMTEFEMLINIIGIFIFTILLCVKYDSDSLITWRQLFIPLWLVDGLSIYFCIIVFLRQLGEFQAKSAAFRLFFSFFFLATRFVAKLMVYFILSTNSENIYNDENRKLKFQHASIPMFFHLGMLMFRSCRLHKYQVFY